MQAVNLKGGAKGSSFDVIFAGDENATLRDVWFVNGIGSPRNSWPNIFSSDGCFSWVMRLIPCLPN